MEGQPLRPLRQQEQLRRREHTRTALHRNAEQEPGALPRQHPRLAGRASGQGSDPRQAGDETRVLGQPGSRSGRARRDHPRAIGGPGVPSGHLLGAYPSLDAAAKADNWPDRGSLRGKVFFDGDASAWVARPTEWYNLNHYFLVMTDAHRVAPAIDARNPTVEQATQRVTELAGRHASMVSSDWTGLTTVLPLVLPRG